MKDLIKMLFIDNPELEEAVMTVLSSVLGFTWPAPMISIISLDWGYVKR